ncbi:MAG: guanylate kinase [Patescibacteria group bacterium]|nr:guanylate kinase [Patescibacteria group bacterium]
MNKKNNLFIISGPSGVGEDSVIFGLKKCLDIKKIITTTTRKIRSNETEGKEYYFISKQEFKKGIANNEFFEYAEEDNAQFYGVKNKEIKNAFNSEKIGIWKIDYKGVITAKKLMPQIIAILILPPSLKTLEKRLSKRGETKEFIKQRIDYAKGWLEYKNIFDYQIINRENRLAETVKKVKKIILNNIDK